MKTSHHSYQNPQKQDWVKGILSLVIYVAVIGVSAFWLLPDYWYLWLTLVLGGMLLIVNWHTRSYAYRCRNCGHEFEISFLANLVAPHGLDQEGAWSWLKCPQCLGRHKATVIKIIKTV